MAKKNVQIEFRRDKARGSILRCDLWIWSSDRADAEQLAHVTLKDFSADQETTIVKLPVGTYVATARVWVTRAVNGKCGHEVFIKGVSMGQPDTTDIGTDEGTVFNYQMSFQVS